MKISILFSAVLILPYCEGKNNLGRRIRKKNLLGDIDVNLANLIREHTKNPHYNILD